MKNKKVRLFLPFLVLFSPFYSFVSCNEAKSNFHNQTNVQNKKNFYSNKEIDLLLKDIFENNLEKINNYILEQENISDKKLEDLKFSLFVYNPLRPNQAQGGNSNEAVVKIGKSILEENLNNNWYWILKNLDLLEFLHYPYDVNRFTSNFYSQKEDEYFKTDSLNFLNLKGKSIDFFIKVHKQLEDNILASKDIFYIVIDKNKVIRLQKFVYKNNIFKFRLDSQIYEINKENITKEDIELFANKFESKQEEIIKEKIEKDKKDFDEDLEYELEDEEDVTEEEKNQRKLEGYKKIEEKYSNLNNLNISNSTTFLNLDFLVFKALEKEFSLKKYLLKNINSSFINNKKEENDNQETNDKFYIDNDFKKFINPSLDIIDKGKTIEEKNTDNILSLILNIQFNKDEDMINKFIKNQQEKEKQIEEGFKNFAKEIKKSSSFDFKKNPIYLQYKNFLSQNWYFVLKNLTKFKAVFSNWFTLPITNKVDKNGNKLSPSKEYLESLEDLDSYSDSYFSNNLLNEIKEGDTTALSNSYKDLYIKRNNQIFNIKISLKDSGTTLEFNPFIFYFANSKTDNISINAITTIFHNAIYHDSFQHYQAFENDLIKKFRYGQPAEMLIIWKDLNEN
ncbi:aromatic motif membrane protein [Mycoplasma sp. AC157]